MNFYVENEVGADFGFGIEEIMDAVGRKILEQERCPFDTQVNLLITDNEGIREFNRQMRQIDAPTDVLSFPMIDYTQPADFSDLEESSFDCFDPESGELVLGDIVISENKVREQAKEYGHSLKRELAFLIAHSMLHLCGYDHMTQEEAHIMEKKQEEALNALRITRRDGQDE